MTNERRERQAVYVISVAAELAGMHPQTVRMYERRGLVEPARTEGGNRRYSDADIAVLRRIQEMTDQGLNLLGVKRILELEARLVDYERQIAALQAAAQEAVEETHRHYRRDLVPLSQALTVYRKSRRR